MISQEALEKLREIILSCLKAHDLQLVGINYCGRNRPVLTILIDKPQGGITIEECAQMNTIISEALDSTDILSSDYAMEISSPGVDRPLSARNDFCRTMGKRVRCFLREPVSGKKEIDGLVKQADDEFLSLDTTSGEIKVSYANITKAKQIID